MSKDTGGQAFPTTEKNYWNENMRDEGMTLRDYFAAKVLNGLVAVVASNYGVGANYPAETGNLAKCAYAVADAMLKARSE